MIQPHYGGRSFAQLPGLIHALLDRDRQSPLMDELGDVAGVYERVVFFFLDAFGWAFCQRHAASLPALRHFSAGAMLKITSQFPSTTAAHVTTFGSGLPVGEHGVFEWQYYEPSLDAMIVPLLFSWAGEKQPELMRLAGVDPAAILPPRTLFQEYAAAGVNSTIFLPREYLLGSYNQHMTRGAQAFGYKTLPEALVNLRHRLDQDSAPACFYFYYPWIDSTCHEYGPDAPQTAAEIVGFFTLLERLFLAGLPDQGGRTLLLLGADHGQTAVDPAKTIYLNRLPEFERLRPWLRCDRRGRLLTPGGSARDMFLYVRDEALDEAQAFLTELLAGRADVYRTGELMEAGLFGPVISPHFRARVSNLVILPHAHETVWWYEKDRFEQNFFGHHGGLSADEMEIPLLAVPL